MVENQTSQLVARRKAILRRFHGVTDPSRPSTPVRIIRSGGREVAVSQETGTVVGTAGLTPAQFEQQQTQLAQQQAQARETRKITTRTTETTTDLRATSQQQELRRPQTISQQLKSQEQIEAERIQFEEERKKLQERSALRSPILFLKSKLFEAGILTPEFQQPEKSKFQTTISEPFGTGIQQKEALGTASLVSQQKVQEIRTKLEESAKQKIESERDRLQKKVDLKAKSLQSKIDKGEISLEQATGELQEFQTKVEEFAKSREASIERKLEKEKRQEISKLDDEIRKELQKKGLSQEQISAPVSKKLFTRLVETGREAEREAQKLESRGVRETTDVGLISPVVATGAVRSTLVGEQTKEQAKLAQLREGTQIARLEAGAVRNPLRTATGVIAGATITALSIPLATVGVVGAGVVAVGSVALGGLFVAGSIAEVKAQPTTELKEIKIGEIGAELVGFGLGAKATTKAITKIRQVRSARELREATFEEELISKTEKIGERIKPTETRFKLTGETKISKIKVKGKEKTTFQPVDETTITGAGEGTFEVTITPKRKGGRPRKTLGILEDVSFTKVGEEITTTAILSRAETAQSKAQSATRLIQRKILGKEPVFRPTESGLPVLTETGFRVSELITEQRIAKAPKVVQRPFEVEFLRTEKRSRLTRESLGLVKSELAIERPEVTAPTESGVPVVVQESFRLIREEAKLISQFKTPRTPDIDFKATVTLPQQTKTLREILKKADISRSIGKKAQFDISRLTQQELIREIRQQTQQILREPTTTTKVEQDLSRTRVRSRADLITEVIKDIEAEAISRRTRTVARLTPKLATTPIEKFLTKQLTALNIRQQTLQRLRLEQVTQQALIQTQITSLTPPLQSILPKVATELTTTPPTPPTPFTFIPPVPPPIFALRPTLTGFAGGRDRRRKRRTRDVLFFTEGFTSKVLGLEPVTLTRQQARKLLQTPLTGLEIRRGVIIK